MVATPEPPLENRCRSRAARHAVLPIPLAAQVTANVGRGRQTALPRHIGPNPVTRDAGPKADAPNRPRRQARRRPHRTAPATSPFTRSVPGAARKQDTGFSQQEPKTPSRGSVPFDGIRCVDRFALDCLPSAFRSQGFSPSQRFNPDTPSWLYFKPHPSLGFGDLQSFSHPCQP
jgi:hypothetical protein